MEPLVPPLPTFLIIGAQKSATRWLRLNLGLHPEVFTAVDGDRVLQQRRPLPRRAAPTGTARSSTGWAGEAIVGEATPGYMFWRHRPAVVVRAHRGDAARRAPDRDAPQPDRPCAVGDGAPHRGRRAAARLGAASTSCRDRRPEKRPARDHRRRLVRREPRAVPGALRRPAPRRAPRRRRRRSARRVRPPRSATSARPPTSCRPSSSGCASASSRQRLVASPAAGRSRSPSAASSGSSSPTTSPSSSR